MPLKRMLGQSRNFDPQATAILLEAYDGAVAELGLQATAEKEKAARIVLQLARDQMDLDVTKLRAGTVALMMRGGSATVNRVPPGSGCPNG